MTSKPGSLRRAIVALGLALLASLAVGALAASAASAETQHWHACAHEWGGEEFRDSICSEEAVEDQGSYGLRTPSAGSAEELEMNGAGPFTLTYRDGGYGPFELECSTQASKESTVENPSGGGAGAAEVKLSLSGCGVNEPSSCQVAEPIEILATGEATEFGDKPAVRFGSGENALFQFSLEGGGCPFNYAHTVYGTVTGVAAENGSLEFTKASSDLTSSGREATLAGSSEIETAAGEALMLTPVAAPVWRLQSTPNPSSVSMLIGVSCASTGECTAVGLSSLASLAQSWNGSEWSTTASPGEGHSLGDVSCASSSLCVAVPISGLGAQRWNGSAWTTITAAAPAKATSSSLFGVSCYSSSACVAVGKSNFSGGVSRALTESWNGSTWSIMKEPASEEGGANALYSVSCTSSTSCTAIGTTGGKPTAQRWDGSEWNALGTPARSSGGGASVSCSAANACTAVLGNSQVERWDGGKWSADSAPAPAGGSSVTLNGVSCASTAACTAVGSYKNAEGATRTLAESWDGGEWSVRITPNQEGATNVFHGVSCATASRCTAVGYSGGGGEDKTLAERFE